MRRYFILFISITLFSISCGGQKPPSLKIEKVYLDHLDSTKNCYTLIYPPKFPWKGYIILLPGLGETAERVLQQSTLPKKLALKVFSRLFRFFKMEYYLLVLTV